MIGDAAQYQELVILYARYGDCDELLGLAWATSNLTAEAQESLRGEISRRGIEASSLPKPTEPGVLSGDDLADLRAFAALAPAECIFEYEDGRSAAEASLALREAGINSILLQGDGSRMDVQGPRVVVAAEDAEDAAILLAQPLADKFTPEVGEFALRESAVLACPKCQSYETLLEAVEPVNRWRCDNCGHDWLEDNVSTEAK